MDDSFLPPEIAEHIAPGSIFERPFQGTAFETYIISSGSGRFVLKIGRSPRLGAELAAEQRVLVALAGYRPFIPTPLAFTVEEDAGFSLLSFIEGRNVAEAVKEEEEEVGGRHALVAQFAWTLRRIHGWQTPLPQPADWLGKALDRATRHVESGLVASPIEHRGRFNGMDAGTLLAELRRWRHTVPNDLVFAHGDYCLPNVLIQDGTVSGVIDWSRGAYADRRADLAAAAWSIRYNLKDPNYVSTFLSAYGYDQPAESLDSFEALDVLT